MTKAQKIAIERLKENFLARCVSGNREDYEYKRWEIRELSFGIISISAEVGTKNDEETMAAVLCRTWGHMHIGVRGGIRVSDLRDGLQGVAVKYRNQWIRKRNN